MRPYGSRKCHCNGKASRGRERRLASSDIAEQVAGHVSAHELNECDGDCRNCDVTWDWYEDWMMMQLAVSDAELEQAASHFAGQRGPVDMSNWDFENIPEDGL